MIISFSNGIKIKTSEYVYTPAEDTFFLEDKIHEFLEFHEISNIKKIAEMGCGSGYILISIMKKLHNCEFTAIDKNLHAINLTKENILLNNLKDIRISFVHSDLFTNVENQIFDFIIFNPPYLPKENYNYTTEKELILKDAWEGGDYVINEFLTNADRFLTKNGLIFMILSNYQVKRDQIRDYLNNTNSNFFLIETAKKKLDLETLYFVILRS